MSRRSFVAAGALATCVRPLFAQREVAGPATIRLGLTSYTFRNFMRAPLIGFMGQLKLDALNAKDVKDHLSVEPQSEAQAAAGYAAAGVKLHAVGAVYFREASDAAVRANFEYAKRARVPVIVAGDPAPENLPRIAAFAREYDIRVAIHNHGPEDKLWPSPLDVLRAVKGLDPRVGCCIDVGHTVRAGTDIVEAIHAAGPRLFNVHMKDLADFSAKESQVAVGEGKMPVRAIFEALLAIGYPGWVDLEYEIHPEEPLPGVMASFACMRGVLAGMGATEVS